MANSESIHLDKWSQLRKLLDDRLTLENLKAFWMDLFKTLFTADKPGCSLPDGIIALIDRAKRENKLPFLYQQIWEGREDLRSELESLKQVFFPRSEKEVIKKKEEISVVIPYRRNPFFTGRETELAAIDQALAKQGQVAIQALAGLGGIGKTAIAIEYAYRHWKNHPDEHVFWIIADNNSNVVSSFNNIAKKLGFSLDEKQDEIIAKVKDWLEDHSNWLIIFDNLEDWIVLTGYLPTPFEGKVLITTQLADTAYLANIEIKKFGELDGVKFLLNRAKITAPTANDQQFAAKLVQELDGLPLAIEQAGTYIAENQLSIQEYLQLYQEGRFTLLAKPSGSSTHDTVTVTFKLLFDKLKETNSVAADLLRFMAFLAPDAIPEEIFKLGREHLSEKLQTAIADELGWDDVCEAATGYSLIKRDSKSFSVHRLVQLVIREMLAEDEQRQWLESVVKTLAYGFPDSDKIENWPLCARLAPHQQMLFEHIQHYQLFNEASGLMLHQAGYYLQAQGQYQQSELLMKEALEIRKQVLGTRHPDYATSLHNLAALYQYQGQYQQAEPLYREALEITKQVLGTQHPDYATSLNNLAFLYCYQGWYDQAELLYREALEIRKQVLGTRHPDYAISLNNLAGLYQYQGQYQQSEPLLKQALEITKQVLGTRHPDYAQSLNNLAGLYESQGQYEQAEPLYREALEIIKQVLGTRHPDYASSLNNLALLYCSQGRYEQAEPLYQQALEVYKQVLGTNHRDYASSLNNLALLYCYQGRYEEAEPLYREDLKITKQALGTNHPDCATSLNNLAGLYHEQGQYQQAELLYREALEITKQALGTNHPDYAQSLNNLARLYQAQSQYQQAELLYREALEIRKQVLDTDHPDYAQSLHNLAGLYQAQSQYQQAELFYQQALEIRKQALGTLHPDYATSLNNLATLYAFQGRFDQAIPLIKQALSIWIKTLPREHPHTNTAFDSLIQTLIKAGQLQPDQVEAAIPQLLLEIVQTEVE